VTRGDEVEKYGVMVDICPCCKGVWLDRVELEKTALTEERDDSTRDPRGERDEHSRDHHDKDGSRGEYSTERPAGAPC
jgi:uncharacterized protein